MQIVDFAQDTRWSRMFYGEPAQKDIKALASYLWKNENTIRLYHGTSAQIPILEQGLKPTTARTAKSLQSSRGFVYLSVFPGMAQMFGEMAYPHRDIAVYAVDIPIRLLKPDKDQLNNQRSWARRDIGNTLAESLVYGHGARVKGRIFPYMISTHKTAAIA
jgi:hypothetical protein